jgi:hypothetical protein
MQFESSVNMECQVGNFSNRSRGNSNFEATTSLAVQNRVGSNATTAPCCMVSARGIKSRRATSSNQSLNHIFIAIIQGSLVVSLFLVELLFFFGLRGGVANLKNSYQVTTYTAK